MTSKQQHDTSDLSPEGQRSERKLKALSVIASASDEVLESIIGLGRNCTSANIEPENQESQQSHSIFTIEEAATLAKAALEGDYDKPDNLVRMLLPLLDGCKDWRTRDAIYLLIHGAFAHSQPFSAACDEYVAAVRAGRNATEEWRSRRDYSAHSAHNAAGIQDRRELETERLCELLDILNDDPGTRALFKAILEAKATPDDQQAQLLAVSLCLVEVMENPCTPSALYNEIGDTLTDIQNEHEGEGAQERDLRAGFFVPAMMAAAQKSKAGQGDQ